MLCLVYEQKYRKIPGIPPFCFPHVRLIPKLRRFMSLFWATLLSGLTLVAAGGAYFFKASSLREWSIAWPRSKSASVLLFGSATLWFLWHVLNLSKADFGDYKNILLVAFGTVAIGSFFVVRDFLAVRGLAVLMLLAARPLLDSAYMLFQYPQRLVLVVAVYIGIILALWIGASPFRMRDFYSWLYARETRPRLVGGIVAVYGLILVIVSLTY